MWASKIIFQNWWSLQLKRLGIAALVCITVENYAFCFLWTELNGQEGSSEIGTALPKWIEQLPVNITNISLFSDTCSGQNRNQYTAALFLYIVTHSKIDDITHNFMESEHSYMEVDRVSKKNVPVYTIHEYLLTRSVQ